VSLSCFLLVLLIYFQKQWVQIMDIIQNEKNTKNPNSSVVLNIIINHIIVLDIVVNKEPKIVLEDKVCLES